MYVSTSTEGFCQHQWAEVGAGKQLSRGGVIAVVHETHWTVGSLAHPWKKRGGDLQIFRQHILLGWAGTPNHRQSLTLFPRDSCFPSRDINSSL